MGEEAIIEKQLSLFYQEQGSQDWPDSHARNIRAKGGLGRPGFGPETRKHAPDLAERNRWQTTVAFFPDQLVGQRYIGMCRSLGIFLGSSGELWQTEAQCLCDRNFATYVRLGHVELDLAIESGDFSRRIIRHEPR